MNENIMPTLYMMVGIPGCGKSSYAESLEVKIFASDKLREELWGDESIQGDNKELFSELHKRIKDCLKQRLSCVYDATNINAKKRTAFIKELAKIDCRKVCIFMVTDIDICLERNEERGRSVPIEVIDRMYRNIDIPQFREGWDEIRIIRTRKEGKDYNIFHLIDDLSEIEHDNSHHILNIGNHICAVANHIAKVYAPKIAPNFNRMSNLLEAAFYHDIGKGYTKAFFNSNGEPTEEAHYYGHEHVSAYMYFLYNDKEILDESIEDSLYVADLIQLHMKMHCIGSQDKKRQLEKIERMVGIQKYQDLLMLKEADEAGA